MPKDTATPDPKVLAWLDELHQSRKREKSYRKEAKELNDVYEGKNTQRDQFNILYSNTETLTPALYNSTPRVTVKRRFNDADPMAKAASQVVQRALEYQLDDGLAEFTAFDTLVEGAVLQSLVPGRGVLRFCYKAQTAPMEAEAVQAAEGESQPAPAERVVQENVYGKLVSWDNFFHGYGKTWEELPWVGFRDFYSEEETRRAFPEVAAALSARVYQQDDEEYESIEEEKRGAKLVEIFEIWDKESQTQLFIAAQYPQGFLRAPASDPYRLSGFFPMPKPLMLFNTISEYMPVPLYRMYRAQAEELNLITVRIQHITAALKVRGFYDAQISGIEKLFEAGDNTLLPMENVAALYGASGGGGLDKALLLMPIEKLVSVLQQLYAQRQQIKQVIYEITGIADIMRGVSQASETLGAQELKNQWGTLRLKRFQRRTALFVRHCLRVMAEMMVNLFGEETLKEMTGLPFPTAEEKNQAQALVQLMQAQGVQPDPQAAQVLGQPSWEELLSLLKSDLQRSYRVDIETNSTLDAEATEDKQDIQELLGALAQFMSAVGPLVESGVLPFEIAKGMLLAVSRRYRLGGEFEEELAKMQAPQPKPDPGAELKKLELQAKQSEMQHQQKLLEMDMMLKQQEHGFKMQEMQQKHDIAGKEHVMKLQQLAVQAAVPKGPTKTARSNG